MPEPAQKPGKSVQVFRTPDNFLAPVRTLLGIAEFTFDFAADHTNTVAPCYWDEEVNALAPEQDAQRWADMTNQTYLGTTKGWGWLNPPFARIAPWAQRCWEMRELGGQVALLVPAAVGSNWWRDYVHGKAHVLFLNGRLHFMPEKPKWGYPKDCALCLYSSAPEWEPTYKVWTWKG